MAKRPAIPPFRGVSNNESFFNTGQPFCPPDAAENVLVFDATKDRPRMGTRPGLEEFFTGTFGNGSRMQGSGIVSRGRTPSGYVLGTGSDIAGTDGGGHVQGAIAGNVWVRNPAWGLTGYVYENVTATGPFGDTGVNTQINRSVSVCALSPDGSKLLIGETYHDGSANTVARVTCRSAATLAVIWSAKLTDAGIDRIVRAIAVSADWVFVATNHFLRVYKLSDGSNPTASGGTHNVFGFNNWSSVAVDVALSPDGHSLYGLFLGSANGATLPNGPVVTAGKYAQHFRSGIMKFSITPAAQLASVGDVLIQQIWSPQLGNTDTYYEGAPSPAISRHGYLRFSEQLPWAPRGCFPTAMAVLPSGNIAVTHANAAWGPNGVPGNPHYFAPDGSGGYFNLSVFDPNGVLIWKSDNDSIITEDGDGGFMNDILSPTALDVAAAPDGSVATTGRRTTPIGDPDGVTVTVLDADGQFVWDKDLGQTMRTLKYLPISGDLAVGGDYGDDYDGAVGGQNRQLFALRKLDGGILRSDDLGAVATLGLAARADDTLFQVTEKV